MFGIDVNIPALPDEETRLAFIKHYAEVSGRRLAALKDKDKPWWEQEIPFFDVQKSRAWILVRRVAHTAHHRGQAIVYLRLKGIEPPKYRF